jgi:hypothetical protein
MPPLSLIAAINSNHRSIIHPHSLNSNIVWLKMKMVCCNRFYAIIVRFNFRDGRLLQFYVVILGL